MYVWRLDYAGIVLLVVTSFYPAVFYGFLCQPFWCNFYLSTTTIVGEAVERPCRCCMYASPAEVWILDYRRLHHRLPTHTCS